MPLLLLLLLEVCLRECQRDVFPEGAGGDRGAQEIVGGLFRQDLCIIIGSINSICALLKAGNRINSAICYLTQLFN